MADATSPSDEKTISFSVKSSSDQKFSVTVPESMSVADLKEKLSTAEYADISPERQRLIYSGRVLKDPDLLATYKIKDGNTVHMVKGAASSQTQNSSAQSSTATSGDARASAAASGVPQNLAAGTGNDPLAALTGARYAGFAQMPGASTFGPDGGMGPPPNPEDMLSMLENPQFASQMNEAMNNPDVIRMMTNNPMVQQNPFLRQALENPEFRRMMMDPQVIRASMQMSRMMGPGSQGQGQGAIAPGVTDTTPPQSGAAGGTTSPRADGQPTANSTSATPFNPFQFLGQGGAGGATGGAANPFAALFGGMGAPQPSNTTTSTADTRSSTTSSLPQQPANPFGSLFGAQPPAAAPGQAQTPLGSMMQQMMQNPAAMQQAMQELQGMGLGGGGGNPALGNAAAGGGFNPFAMFGPGGSGMGMGAPAVQQDTRPPEEQYASQLQQLNEMGFYEFERNIRALRMSGGSVQGAVEMLLGGGV